MIEAVGKYVGGKVITAVLVVTSGVVLIWYWQLEPEQKQAIWDTIKYSIVWVGFAGVLPWALFFVPSLVLRTESNLVSALALGGYLLTDVLMALYLAGWHVEGGVLTWAVLILGFLCATVYNFAVTESLARHAEDTL